MKNDSERVDQKVRELLEIPGNKPHRCMYPGANRMIFRRLAERELRYEQEQDFGGIDSPVC